MSLLADIKQYKHKSWASTRKPSLAFRDIGWAVGLAGTCLGFICFGMSSGDASAASITVSITDSSADLNLVATEGGVAYGESDTASFSVSTTSSGGYTATITGGNSTGRLTGTDSNNYFASISSAIASPSNFDNGTWGFKPSSYNSASNTSYRPVPTSTTAATIDVTNSATTGNYTLSVAAKTDTNTAADTYSYNLVVAATTNAIDYDIAFVNPADGMPARMTDSTTGSSVTLPSDTPTMSGYVFAGWCTVSVSVGSACTGTTYQPGASFPLNSGSTNDVTLYAIWVEAVTFDEAFANAGKSKTGNYYRMDDMTTSICDAVTEHEVGTLVDTRGTSGTQTYTVAKLKDGKCWMTQNLRLTYNTSTIAVSDGAGGTINWAPESATVTGSGTNCSASGVSYYYDDPRSVYCNDATNGVYYNWTAAIAVNDSWDYNRFDKVVDTSICPKGWKLPQYAEGAGSFYNLYQNYNSSSLMRSSPVNFVLAGLYYSGSVTSVGSDGYYWLSSAAGNNDACLMELDSSSVNPQNSYDRSYGLSVRCVSI